MNKDKFTENFNAGMQAFAEVVENLELDWFTTKELLKHMFIATSLAVYESHNDDELFSFGIEEMDAIEFKLERLEKKLREKRDASQSR